VSQEPRGRAASTAEAPDLLAGRYGRQMKIRTIEDVAAWQLCCGCGVCAYISPDEIEMIDTLEYGRRPRFKTGSACDARSAEALRVCPGIGLPAARDADAPGVIPELLPEWGGVLEVWEGYAADEHIRHEASSGGLATALALYALERGQMHGTVHTMAGEGAPYLNQTVWSTTGEDLLAGAGSRYAPASPCDGLHRIEEAPGPCVFVGKPCDVAAARQATALRPRLAENLGLTIAFFCAGTPSTLGTVKMLEAMGVEDLSCVQSIRYRGRGWPGRATVVFSRNGSVETGELTYEQSWGDILQKYRQWRCYLCADHVGEFADIAVADAWHRPLEEGQPGLSVVLVRSERGRETLRQARQAGYVHLEQSGPDILPACRPGQGAALGNLWGRLAALRIMGLPAPRYEGRSLWTLWRTQLSLAQKAKSLAGTARRVVRKRLHRKHPVVAWPNNESRG
jgi:coenzyme F420 hydrogenase subunit beta